MTKNVLPESPNQLYCDQQKIVTKLAEKDLIGYEIPEILEATTCILSQYFFDSKTCLFANERLSTTYTYCKEGIEGRQTAVGDFAPIWSSSTPGLQLDLHSGNSYHMGVAALRRF